MRENIVKGDFWSSIFPHIFDRRQFNANFRKRRIANAAFIEHTVFYQEARNNSRVSSDL